MMITDTRLRKSSIKAVLSNIEFESQFMKKSSNIEAELKKTVTYKKACF